MTSRNILTCHGLAKAFGPASRRITVVDGLDLEVAAGSFTLIKGPSGCGKSTLLAMLAGLTPPDAGSVHAFGTDVWALDRKARDALRAGAHGVHLPGRGALPRLERAGSGRALADRDGHVARGRPRAGRAGARRGRDGREGASPTGVPLGGREAARRDRHGTCEAARIIFADEPTSALDTGNERWRSRRSFARRPPPWAAVLCVTHDDRLSAHADRILWMRDGRIAVDQLVVGHSA